jgi:Peptidase family M23
MTTSRTISTARAFTIVALSTILLSLGICGVGSAVAGSESTGCTGEYGWPVKPFDRAHPIRGSFGDPRMIFDGPPTFDTLLRGSGRFSFHQGVDISAPDGEPVYAVASGTVVRVTSEWVGVECASGRAFEYWHVNTTLHVGQRVLAGKTVIGLVQRSEEHVHLTQIEDGRVVNPVARGRLTPYRNTTAPRILDIALHRGDGASEEMPYFVQGTIQPVVEAVDTPELRVPGIWGDMPITPARLTWRIEKWTGRVVVTERITRDVRETVPSNARFWDTFARGTYQNMAVFGSHYSYLQNGRYLFKLSATPFDTRTLRDGVYTLVVQAEDTAGNRDVQRLRFTVHNRGGWR